MKLDLIFAFWIALWAKNADLHSNLHFIKTHISTIPISPKTLKFVCSDKISRLIFRRYNLTTS